MSAIYNTAQSKRTFTPEDFFPSLASTRKQSQVSRIGSAEETAANLAAIKALSGVFGIPLVKTEEVA